MMDWNDAKLGEWVYKLCVDFGIDALTALKVASVFIEGIRFKRGIC